MGNVVHGVLDRSTDRIGIFTNDRNLAKEFVEKNKELCYEVKDVEPRGETKENYIYTLRYTDDRMNLYEDYYFDIDLAKKNFVILLKASDNYFIELIKTKITDDAELFPLLFPSDTVLFTRDPEDTSRIEKEMDEAIKNHINDKLDFKYVGIFFSYSVRLFLTNQKVNNQKVVYKNDLGIRLENDWRYYTDIKYAMNDTQSSESVYQAKLLHHGNVFILKDSTTCGSRVRVDNEYRDTFKYEGGGIYIVRYKDIEKESHQTIVYRAECEIAKEVISILKSDRIHVWYWKCKNGETLMYRVSLWFCIKGFDNNVW